MSQARCEGPNSTNAQKTHRGEDTQGTKVSKVYNLANSIVVQHVPINHFMENENAFSGNDFIHVGLTYLDAAKSFKKLSGCKNENSSSNFC